MQNGQKANIPLDSGLDVKSSDMLVPVDRPLFHHNRQKYQGRYLPSSVRFEHDGWAAGHDVYEFDVAEAQVQVDDITIIRKTLNDNPAYEVRLLDMDRNILGTLVYNAEGRIKDYTVDSCEIADGHVTGLFNNKPFDLLYDRNDINAVPVQQVPDSDIQLDEFEKLSEYASRIKLYDEKARIELTFAGMYLPSDKIYNGDYLFGKFMQYLGNISEAWPVTNYASFSAFPDTGSFHVVYHAEDDDSDWIWSGEFYTEVSEIPVDDNRSDWQCGSYTFSVFHDDDTDQYSMRLIDRDGNAVPLESGATVTPVQDSNEVDVHFTADIAQEADLFTDWQDIFPFFKHVDVTAPKSNFLIAYDADESIVYNRWGCGIQNVPAQGIAMPDGNEYFLYRNSFNGHNDYNHKIVKHFIPVWIGISNLGFNTTFIANNNKVSQYSTTYDDAYYMFDNILRTTFSSHATANKKYFVRYDQDTFVTDIIGSCWLGSKRTEIHESSLTNPLFNQSITFRYKYVDLSNVNTNPDIWNSSTDWFKDSDWYNRDYMSSYIKSGFSEVQLDAIVRWYAPFFNREITPAEYKTLLGDAFLFENRSARQTSDGYIPQCIMWVDRITLWFRADVYNIAAMDMLDDFFVPTAGSQGTLQWAKDIDFEYNLSAKFTTKQLSNATSVTVTDREHDTYATMEVKQPLSYATSNIDNRCYWAACCNGALLSDICIKSTDVLTDRLDATDFELVPVPEENYALYSAGDYPYLGNTFRHRLSHASCDGKLTLSLSLCGIDSLVYLYYTSSDSNAHDYTNEIPAHIKYDTLDSSQYADRSPLKFIAIRPVYDNKDARNSDTDLNVLVIGEAAQFDEYAAFRCIKNIDDKLNTKDILPGNRFTESVLPSFIEKSLFELSDFDFWIDVQNVYSSDKLYIKNSTNQNVSMLVDGVQKYTAAYDWINDQISQPSVNQFIFDGEVIKVSNLRYDSESKGFKVDYTVPVEYAMRIAVPSVPDSLMHLVSLKNNVAVVDTNYAVVVGIMVIIRYIRLTIDFDMRQVTVSESYDQGETYTVPRDCEEDWFSFTGVNILYDGSAYMTLVLEGIENYSHLDSVVYDAFSQGEAVIRVKLTDGPYVDIPKSMPASGIGCFYTDTRDKLMDRIQFAELKTDSELQFLRQQWNTDNSTENFWWIDRDSILELTRDKFILKKRTNELDDWGGDVFSADTDDGGFWWKRSDVIDSRTRKYFCSDAKGTSSRFIRVSCNGNNIYLDIYNPLSRNAQQKYDMLDTKQRIFVTLSRKKITEDGTFLNSATSMNTVALNTFSDILPEVLVTHAKWSATCIGSFIIIGIHYDNNMNQWAVVVNLFSGTVYNIIQGYGCVGADGSLTGGEIPAKYFDPMVGFTGRVYDVKSLVQESYNIRSIDELWTIQDKIVGDDTQQWYISKDIKSIVSHLRYTGNGVFEAVELKLNNNYSVDYDSASYASSVMSDSSLQIESIASAFPINNTAWTIALVTWAYPILFYFAPRISVMNYLQQTIGQAAYVHYNSASIWQKALSSDNENIDSSKFDNVYSYKNPLNPAVHEQQALTRKHADTGEFSFDTQAVKQEQSISDPYTTILTICAAAVGALNDWTVDNVEAGLDREGFVLNAKGDWSDYFEKAITSSRMSGLGTQSVYSTQISEITTLKTLDMFYSTCDKQHVNAGRGYVNHNFVAQCISQSMEDIHISMLQQRFTFVIKELTLLPMQLIYKGLDSTRKALYSQVVASGGSEMYGAGLFVLATIPVAIGLAIAYAVADIACNYYEIGIAIIKDLLEALGGGKLQASVTARQNTARPTIETKHRYGSRSESFMWPCFGVDAPQTITDESVTVVMENKPWRLDLPTNAPRTQSAGTQPDFVTQNIPVALRDEFKGEVPYFVAMVKGEHKDVQLPDKMAYVIGTESFLPPSNYKNRSVGESEPVFPTPPFQDYIIDESWQLAQTASDGMTTWVSCRDTKLIDGDYSNIVVSDDFCGVACPYTAIEVKRGIEKKYIRPWAVTPNAVALNNTGINCMFEEKAYHAFDGYGSRIVNWMGSPGIGKEKQTLQYAFLTNDRFKRSNKLPPNEFMGNFKSEPKIAVHGDMNDSVFSIATQPGENTGMLTGTVGEDKDVRRYALPVFSEFVNTLPAVVKTVSSQTLSIVDGVTSLTTANRDLQTAYKSPVSVDFSIGKNKYRYTYEYICSVENDDTTGVTIVTELVPCLGLKFIGSTPYEAYLYSDATRQYYKFTGGTSISSVDTIERFRGVISGRYDFISQEVVLPCVATFDRLDGKVHDDDDETDNVIVPLLKDSGFIGEVPPPLDTIYNKKFRTLSLPSGVAFQGPNRCIINRFVVQDYMIDQIRSNYGKWKRVSRETYHPFREYKAKFHDVETFIADDVEVNGWTHNPFLLVTAPLGVAESVDCMFEWEITFCWPVEMDKLYGKNNYAVVNVMAETMTPGGKVIADRPAHIFLTKELFTRSNSYGYYSFRYQSKCGIGNRERLHIWSDQYICISGLQVEYQVMTEKRTEILTQQADVTGLKEI